jgi:hypothetical protein
MSSSPSTAAQLQQALIHELSGRIKDILGEDIAFDAPAQWLVGTVLELGVIAPPETWMRILGELDEVLKTSSIMHGYWLDDHALWIQMGLHVWQSTRLDRYSGSRILSVSNSIPMCSFDRLQTLRLVRVNQAGTWNRDFTVLEHSDAQTMVHFLRTSLRLRVVDITRITQLLAGAGVS